VLGHRVECRHIERRSGDVDHSQAANDRLTSLFPHVVPVPLGAGLRATVDWFRTDPAQR
jgi:UDP-glucose 4-epimerase